MRIYLCLILFIYFAFTLSLKEQKTNERLLGSFFRGSFDENGIIEFDEEYIITRIAWTKNDDYKYNYLLGVFEVSNDKSFKEAVPIGMIKEEDGELKEELNISSKNSLKYMRYVAPNKNYSDINPIKLIGYKKSLITEPDVLDENNYFQVTNLPLILIHTENETEPSRWGGDVNCNIKIINEGKVDVSDSAVIKVRGRTTGLIPPKKPYRIKFSKKQKIFNFEGKEKKWTLIANHFDRSLLRNNIAFKISQLMEFPYTPRCLPVDVILNGNYRGNYYICDKIEVGKNRINITKMFETDNSEPNITGGYLLQIDSLARDESRSVFKTQKGITGQIIYPEDDKITAEQENYIKYKLNKFEDEVYNGILDSIDLDSFSKYFIIEEFCGDPDHVWSSYYFRKERNDDKFYFGPAWDYDLAFDNDERLIPTNEKTDFCFKYCDSAGTMREFILSLIENKNVIEYIKNTWEKLYKTVLNENILANYIEEEKKKLEESSELNFIKWNNYVEEDDFRFPWDFGRKGENFEVSVEVVKDYVVNRFKSLTKLIDNYYTSAK